MTNALDRFMEDLRRTVFIDAVESYDDFVQEKFYQMQKLASGIQDDFFSILTSRYMKLEAPPRLPGAQWGMLTKAWVSYKYFVRKGRPKKKKGRGYRSSLNVKGFRFPNEYYFGIGQRRKGGPKQHLIDYYSRLVADDVFGAPLVTQGEISGIRSGYTSYFDRFNHTRYRDKLGRFAKGDDAVSFGTRISVELLPNLSDPSLDASISNLVGLLSTNERMAGKIGGLEKKRPLLVPYLKFYLRYKTMQLKSRI